MSNYLEDCEELRQKGFKPEKMTIAEIEHILRGEPVSQALIEKDRLEQVITHSRNRYVKRYERYSASKQWLKPINAKFWVGVRQGQYPSKPICRGRTRCFSPRPVLKLTNSNKLVFDCYGTYYYIPQSENWAIQYD